MAVLLTGRDRRIGLILMAIAIVIPFIDHNDSHISFLADAGAFVMLALGLNIVVGFAGLLDLGYAAFFAIGSYTYAIFASPQFGANGIHVPFWVMLFAAAGVAGLFGIVLGAPTLRLRGDYLAIVTLGFGEIVPTTLLNMSDLTGGKLDLNGPNGISSLDKPSFFGYHFSDLNAVPFFYLTIVLILFTVWIAGNLQKSRLGRSWMALREDELAAAHMGINTTAAKLAAFALGASYSGFAGVVYSAKLSSVSPDQFGFNVSVFILSMLVLGGMGNIVGVIVGSLVLSSLDRFILPQLTNILASINIHVDLTQSRFLIYGVILVLMMLLRPEGLLPSQQRKAELHASESDAGVGAQEQELYNQAAP